MNVGMFNVTTLVGTEVNHFANEATALTYKECDIDKYQFSATLDIKTCDRCARLDNKVFELKDKKTGVNHPPMHPNDRCTTTPFIGEDEMASLKRRARDENGNSILVPADMNYYEWKAKYIDMSLDEKGAIREYSSSKAYILNEKLRKGIPLNIQDAQLVNNIDSGLKKLPNYEKVTHRQIGFDMQGEKAYNDFIDNHKNNKYINYGQYTSTSKYYGDYEVDDNLKIELTIDGKTGKDIRDLAGIREENEVLFGKDVWFEIVKVDKNKIWLKEV